MAKQDYSIDVGMWAVQPDTVNQKDASLDTLVSHFEKVWDGHSCPTKRACNILMTYGHKDAWGWLNDPDKETREGNYSFDGPWSVGQYTRDPKLAPNDPSLNPLHGTSVNWNGWTEQDEAQAPAGDYDVQLKDSVGNNLGTPITVHVQ